MATTPINPGNMKLSIRGNIPATSAITKYFAVDPSHKTAVHVDKNSELSQVWLTTDTLDSTGAKLTDLEDSNVLWNSVSASGTTNYFGGDNNLITGVKIDKKASGSSAVEYSITQKGRV